MSELEFIGRYLIVCSILLYLYMTFVWDYNYQIKATKRESKVLKCLSANQFIKQFDEVGWKVDSNYKYSFFNGYWCDENCSKYHAGIVIINGYGILFNSWWDFRKVDKFMKMKWKAECDK